jgi:GntR family transcriptional regulator/MocR family aminotransferase
LSQSQADLAFVTPAHHYPMGVMLSASRREELLAWVTQTDSHIVELDFDTEIRYEAHRQPR